MRLCSWLALGKALNPLEHKLHLPLCADLRETLAQAQGSEEVHSLSKTEPKFPLPSFPQHLFSKLPSRWPTKLCLWYSRAFLAQKLPFFTILLQSSYTVRSIPARVPFLSINSITFLITSREYLAKATQERRDYLG